MANEKRNRVYVDSDVQGALVRRIVRYGVCCALFLLLPLIIGWELAHPDAVFFQRLEDIWQQLGLTLITVLILTPIAIYDLLKWSHRFVGPIYRLRNALKQLADGEEVAPIAFRSDDYWHDMAQSFNRISQRLNPPAKNVHLDGDESATCEYAGVTGRD